MYYKECPYCGANLDPGERCECQLTMNYYYNKPNKKRFAEATTPTSQSASGTRYPYRKYDVP